MITYAYNWRAASKYSMTNLGEWRLSIATIRAKTFVYALARVAKTFVSALWRIVTINVIAIWRKCKVLHGARRQGQQSLLNQ